MAEVQLDRRRLHGDQRRDGGLLRSRLGRRGLEATRHGHGCKRRRLEHRHLVGDRRGRGLGTAAASASPASSSAAAASAPASAAPASSAPASSAPASSAAASPADRQPLRPRDRRFDRVGLRGADLARQLDGHPGTIGAGWIRFDIKWVAVRADARVAVNWRHDRVLIAAANARGLRAVATLAYTPALAALRAGTDDKHPPTSLADYTRFARAAVARYAPLGVKHYEIWNEPNIDGFLEARAGPVALHGAC